MADRWDLLLHSVFISREKFSNPSWQVSSGGAHSFSLCLCVCVQVAVPLCKTEELKCWWQGVLCTDIRSQV